jgi:hypothetical protein
MDVLEGGTYWLFTSDLIKIQCCRWSTIMGAMMGGIDKTVSHIKEWEMGYGSTDLIARPL